MVSYETQTKVMFITGLWDENSLKALDAVWSFFHPITNNREKKITDVYKNSGRELHIVFLFLFFFFDASLKYMKANSSSFYATELEQALKVLYSNQQKRGHMCTHT